MRSRASRRMRAHEEPCGSALASPFETRRFAAFRRVRVGRVCAASSLKAFAFSGESSHCFTAANFIFDFIPTRNIFPVVPCRYGARSGGRRSVERDVEVRRRCRTDHGSASGRHECMSGRQSARTGGGGTSSKPWDIQQADKSIRVRNAGEKTASEAPVRLRRSSLASAEPLPVCR